MPKVIAETLQKVGNGGAAAGVIRLLLLLVTTLMSVTGYLLLDNWKSFEGTLESIDSKMSQVQDSALLNSAAIEVLRDRQEDFYSAAQALEDKYNQRQRDERQDDDRRRVERRIESLMRQN